MEWKGLLQNLSKQPNYFAQPPWTQTIELAIENYVLGLPQLVESKAANYKSRKNCWSALTGLAHYEVKKDRRDIHTMEDLVYTKWASRGRFHTDTKQASRNLNRNQISLSRPFPKENSVKVENAISWISTVSLKLAIHALKQFTSGVKMTGKGLLTDSSKCTFHDTF